MAVFVPKSSWGQDQVAFVHGAFLALNGGKAAFAFHHKAHCAGGVAMVRGYFARQDQLHAHINVGRGNQFLDAMARIAQHQNASFCFFNGCQFAGPHELGAHVFVVPNKGLSRARWFATWQQAPQLRPQRGNGQRRHVGDVVSRQVF